MLNSVALDKALTMMGIALPLMFVVIVVVIAATMALRRAFPASGGDDGQRGRQQ